MDTSRFDVHKALGSELNYSCPPHCRYRSGLPVCLTDGLRGTETFATASWAAWRGTTVDLTVDMKTEHSINEVVLGMLRNQMSNIFLPERITVSLSYDGVNFTKVATRRYDSETKAENGLVDLQLAFSETYARYVKVTVSPVPTLPSWRSENGGDTYLFIDEIIVR